ncbi:MAG: 1-acyl-sn-glycerol-3-phosphate acyltransferase [Bacteroidota bacterium]|nr:1-acyl-sn-glycerol-3-phosphate acyltransferase [Bacteroidota bacterium]
MSIIKNIAGRILAVWAALVFAITIFPMALIMWILGFIKEPKRIELFIKISKVWISIYFFLIGCSVKIKGKNNFEKGKNYIIICNHNSLMDILVTTPFIPGPSKTIAKSGLAKIPLFGLIYKRGSVLVNRKDKNSRSNSFKEMKDVLQKGMHMCIYAEGTRNKTNKPLKEFHNGAFKLAVETAKPILPAIIFNTKKALPANKTFFFWPTKMEVHYLPAVEVFLSDNYEDVKNKLFKMMSEYYASHFKLV